MPSIVPTTFRPRFVGGSLGSGLNASLRRKIQLVQFWLDQEYAGVTLEYIQGSPSGSSASGGTHLGPGDAADLRLVDSLGRSPSVNVWVAFSAMMRLLDCVSYVRGSDVNHDGRKDDSFAQHDHVIDREGSGKAYAATLQISQYLAHQNGLMGGRRDLEATVSNPLTLAQYTDAEFMRRYQSLSGTAFKLDVHTEPITTTEEDMLTLILWCYAELVGRAPSVTDVQNWIVNTSGWTPAQVLDGFLNAPCYDAGVIKAYQDFLGRAPESQAVITQILASKPTIRKVRLDVAGSPEAKKKV